MAHDPILVDDTAPFGTYAAENRFYAILRLIRRLPTNWLGTRLMFVLRRMAGRRIGDCVDMNLFGARMRLYKEGNASEKRALFAPQFYDLPDRQALIQLAAPGAVFIDIGANIGLYSFSIAEHFQDFEDTRIISVEPHPDIHRRLAFNRRLNPSLPIDLFQGGIGDRKGLMQLTTSVGNLGQTRILKDNEKDKRNTITVSIITLMQLVEKYGLSRIDGMKIDVEGFEEAVLIPFLDAAPEALLPQVIVIEDNRNAWASDLLGKIEARGFHLVMKTKLNLILRRDR